MNLTIKCAMFALIATAVNIQTQDIVIRNYIGAFDILISVIVGTGAGLVVKYIFDNRHIFRFRARDAAHDGKTFALYVLMGLVLAVIFWGFEYGFDHIFETKEMRYLGGIIALAIGYLAKSLDKRFVFRMQAP